MTQTHTHDDIAADYFSYPDVVEPVANGSNMQTQVLRGATLQHNQIRGNIFAYLKFASRGQLLRPFLRDLGVWVPSQEKVTYPDILVIQGRPKFYQQRTDLVTNPLLLVEVLADPPQAFDRTSAFKMYRSIPELQEYLVVSQNSVQVEQLRKTTDDIWVFQDYTSMNSAIWLTSVNIEIPLSEIYYGVDSAALTPAGAEG